MKTFYKALSRRFLLAAIVLFSSPGLYAQEQSALFWSIEKDGVHSGYLLGTIHSEDPRVLDFTEDFISDMKTCDIFAMEIVPDLPTLNRLTQFMQYQDGSTLESRVGPERYVALRSLLTQYQVPADWVARMKVWAVMITLSVPPPETGLFMDFSLSLRAAGAGLKVVGLETLEQQLSFLEVMPMEQQLALLDQAMNEQAKASKIHELMVDMYLEGNAVALATQADEQLADLDAESRRYFIEQGIEMRNQRMVDSLLPLLQESRVLVAVGALHLPGEIGLVQILRSHGYALKPLPLPLNDAGPASDPGTPR
jgi:uncharacterized protein YbaP (TraB family)